MKVAVYGLGRFGRFWTELLIHRGTSLGLQVFAYNRSERELPAAIEERKITLAEFAHVDALFLCTSISSIPQVAKEISAVLSQNCLVLDTCSVKQFPLQALRTALPKGQPILGTHPMFGPDSADSARLPIVLTPENSIELETWQNLFTHMGLACTVMSAEEHDREVARTQGITHFIGRFLASLDLQPSKIGTLGFQKLFEVMEQTCNDPWRLFLDLQRFNPYSSEIHREMHEKFSELIHTISLGEN